MQSSPIHLVLCDQKILESILEGDQKIAAHLNIQVPKNWSEFGSAIFQYALDKIIAAPDSSKWWTYLPILTSSNTLIGSCGFKGPPTPNGEVELGYEVAKEYRNRGFATEITRHLVDIAFNDHSITVVLAHTLAEKNASVRVLEKCGFKFIEEIIDPNDGTIWKWKLNKKNKI